MKKTSIFLAIIIAAFTCTSVNAQTSKVKNKAATTAAKVYQCPMKCEGEKTYDKAGKCPKCKMNLKEITVAKTKTVAAASYQCPMKCEGEKTYDKAGNCPKCNMSLAKLEEKNK